MFFLIQVYPCPFGRIADGLKVKYGTEDRRIVAGFRGVRRSGEFGLETAPPQM